MLTGWATAFGNGISNAVQLVEIEIDKVTAASPMPLYYFGLAAEVMLAAGRPADGLAHLDRAIATIEEPGVGFNCRKSIGYAANACWRSIVTIRTKRGALSTPLEKLHSDMEP